MTRRMGPSWPSTIHRLSSSFCIGLCGSTVHVSKGFGMRATYGTLGTCSSPASRSTSAPTAHRPPPPRQRGSERRSARVWSHIVDVDRYPSFVPMLSKVKRDGDRVHGALEVQGRLLLRRLRLRRRRQVRGGTSGSTCAASSGEPRDLHIRFELEDAGGGASTLRSTISFDPFSLGWLTKYFLKHHPEIRYGIFPGCAYGLADSMRQAAEGKSTGRTTRFRGRPWTSSC